MCTSNSLPTLTGPPCIHQLESKQPTPTLYIAPSHPPVFQWSSSCGQNRSFRLPFVPRGRFVPSFGTSWFPSDLGIMISPYDRHSSHIYFKSRCIKRRQKDLRNESKGCVLLGKGCDFITQFHGGAQTIIACNSQDRRDMATPDVANDSWLTFWMSRIFACALRLFGWCENGCRTFALKISSNFQDHIASWNGADA